MKKQKKSFIQSFHHNYKPKIQLKKIELKKLQQITDSKQLIEKIITIRSAKV